MSQSFEIKFEMKNAAFHDDHIAEIVRILNDIRAKVESHESACGVIRDINGNIIGEWGY